MEDKYLWTEKYRPRSIDDVVLTKTIKQQLNSALESGTLQNMLLCGSGGIGKTTVAKAVCDQLNLDYIFINGSEQSGIDTLRTKIRQFASTTSLIGGYKVVIIDEADYLNPQSTQPALRGFMEEFHENCRFILTCNFKNRILEQIHSRCAVIDFTIPKKEKPQLASQFFQRAEYILRNEGIDYDKKVLVELITKHQPDWRRIINELQRYSVAGKIDSGILVNMSDENVKVLFGYLKDRNFREMRKWVVENIDLEPTALYRLIYDGLSTYLEPKSIPNIILILAEYQYKDAFVADHEINVVACLTEIMANAEWK